MSRPLRIEFDGAWYHVMNRGASRKEIFCTNNHRELFFELLDYISIKFKVEIHAYCLMSNHYHLLVRTPLGNLNQAMRSLNGIYALRYNRDINKDGPLFRGRYKAILVDDENYLLHLSRYIHLNSLKAKICEKPENYKWSSYSYYLENSYKPSWLVTKEILSRFGQCKMQNNYQKFVDQGIDDNTMNFYKTSKTIPIFGSTEFLNKITIKYLQNKPISKEISEQKIIKKIKSPSVSDVMHATAQYFDINVCDLTISRRGKHNIHRSIAIYLSAKLCQEVCSIIAKEFKNISPGGVSTIYHRINNQMKNDTSLKNIIEILSKLIHDET